MTTLADAQTEEPTRPRRSLWRGVVLLMLFGLALMWAYVFSGRAKHEPVGTLEQRSFPIAAEKVCARVKARVDALPTANTADSPAERATLLRRANPLVVDQIEKLRDLDVAAGHDRAFVTQWLDDWDAYLTERQAYTKAMAAGRDEPFSLPEAGGQPIDERMDFFATVNEMPSCKVPDDL